MDLLGSLGTLATNVKNITLPGVFAALAFALLIWPPRAYDRIPTVVDNHPDIAKLRLSVGQLTDDTEAGLGEYLKQSAPACTVKEGADSYKFLTIPSSLRDRSSVAVKNQLVLDDIDRSLLKCVEEEQALQGIEDQVMANINALIVTRTSERDGINAVYQKYVLSLSPMQGEFKEKLENKEREIAKLQAHLLNFQRIQKERARRVLELNRLEGEMKARLGDPGRLRPAQRFDDVLSALGTHIVGFLTLVFAWGLLVDPINRGLFSLVYDTGFDEAWDHVRPTRQSPGEKAFKKWLGREGQAETVKEHRRYTNRFLAGVARFRSDARLSLLVILACVAAGALAVWKYAPSSIVPRTYTIIRASATSVPTGDSITFTVTVIAPGSPYVPCGTVTFLREEENLGKGDLDREGGIQYTTGGLSPGNYKFTARYEPSSKTTVKCEGSSNFQSSTSVPVAVSVGSPTPKPPIQNNPVIPDLRNPVSPPLMRSCVLCSVVTVLGLIAGFFLPGVLKPLVRSTPMNRAEERPSHEALATFKQALEGDSDTALTCEQKLARDWTKLSQPQYAIGQNLMSRSDFETLQNSYYSQSLVSTGLMLPLFFLVFALLVTPQLGFGGTRLYWVLGLGEVLLLITGVDRRHKYYIELEGLIAGAFLKTCAQNEKKPTTGASVASQINDALKAAKILQKTDLTIVPGDLPPPAPSAPVSGPAPGAAPAPAKADTKGGLGVQGKADTSSDTAGST